MINRIIFLSVLMVSFLFKAEAAKYDSAYGVSCTNNVKVSAGTHEFKVAGIARKMHTKWYVDDEYAGKSENDSSGFWAVDPEYENSFMSGRTTIKAIVYDRDWNKEESHVWRVKVGKPDIIVSDLSVSETMVTRGQKIETSWTVKNQGEVDAGATEQGVFFAGTRDIDIDRAFKIGEKLLWQLEVGETASGSIGFKIPYIAIGSTYYIGVCADHSNRQDEIDESNNGSKVVPVKVDWKRTPPESRIEEKFKVFRY